MTNITNEHLNEHNWFNYAGFYVQMAQKPEFNVYVELGCWKGHSISHLAKHASHKPNLSITAIDYWDTAPNRSGRVELPIDYPNVYEIYNTNLENAGVRHLITDIKGCTWKSAENFEDDSVDFIYVDADHSEAGVLLDIKHWWPKLKKTGVMAGHDYYANDKTGVGPAVRKLFKSEEFTESRTVWVVNKSDIDRDIGV